MRGWKWVKEKVFGCKITPEHKKGYRERYLENLRKEAEDTMSLTQTQKKNIVSMFDDINEALALHTITEILNEHYINPGKIAREAIKEGIIYMDSIDNRGVPYYALTDDGEYLWGM